MRGLIPAVSFCISLLSIPALDAQQLSVRSATAKAINLEWTGGVGSATLERSYGHAFQKIAGADSGKFQDTGIDAFGTYQYRINLGGKFSNVATVGPPPIGVSNAAPAAKGTEYANFGAATSVALDENGDPAIAFEWIDPNGDGDKSDTEIRFVRWDRASYKWMQPVRVATTGPLDDQNRNPIALGCDPATGTFAILAALADSTIYTTSSDRGATWKNSSLPGNITDPHSVVLMVASGQVFAAINAEGGATYLTGAVTDSSSWKAKPIPAGTGWKLQNNTNIAIAADSAGKVGLAFYEGQQEGDEYRYVFWRPEASDPVPMVSKATSDTPNIALSYGNHKFVSLVAAQLDNDEAGRTVWYTQSSDGSSWSKPVKLPVDGPRSTNSPLDLAISSNGQLTAAFGSNSGTGPASCNAPTVSRSTDGANWTTCGLGKAAGADFSPQPATLHAIEAPNDKAYVIWQEPAETKYGPGVLVGREH